ncbi:MAG: hypothetical protein MJZ95_05970 [Paludibacteraceae bacterium]|nr:hypothetical protein [Paludibacteraceae bacterium]
MKKLIVCLALLSSLLCGCVKIIGGDETEEQFKDAPHLYPELTFVTVEELKDILANDNHDYKVVVINKYFFDDLCEKRLSDDIVPKWKSMDTTKVDFYLISADCAYLEEMDSFFVQNNLALPRYVIRDSTDAFCSFKSSDKWNRITKIVQNVCCNSNAITRKLSYLPTFVLDRKNNVKLMQIDFDGKIDVVPMPFELVSDSLEKVDFGEITKYRISKKSRLYEEFYQFYGD